MRLAPTKLSLIFPPDDRIGCEWRSHPKLGDRLNRLGALGVVRVFACLALVAAISSIAPSEAEVFRCSEGGKTVYSDQPCGKSAKTIDVDDSLPPQQALAARLQAAASLGRIVIGQSPAQVEQAWGTPRTRNVDVGSSGRTEQWVYERTSGTSYVYFLGGVVSSFNTRFESGNGSRPGPPVARASTKSELDAQERIEKAGDRKFIREGNSRATVRSRIGEPNAKHWQGDMEYWTYEPAPKDYQTLTVIRFSLYGGVFAVDRTIKR